MAARRRSRRWRLKVDRRIDPSGMEKYGMLCFAHLICYYQLRPCYIDRLLSSTLYNHRRSQCRLLGSTGRPFLNGCLREGHSDANYEYIRVFGTMKYCQKYLTVL